MVKQRFEYFFTPKSFLNSSIAGFEWKTAHKVLDLAHYCIGCVSYNLILQRFCKDLAPPVARMAQDRPAVEVSTIHALGSRSRYARSVPLPRGSSAGSWIWLTVSARSASSGLRMGVGEYA